MPRLLWLIYHGPHGMDGAEIHHRCRHGWCVNPDHLVLLTLQEHKAEHSKSERRRIPEQCKHGHVLDKRNLAIYGARNGRGVTWACKACNRERMARKQKEKKSLTLTL